MLFPTNGLLPELIRDRMETNFRSCPTSVIALKLSVDGIGDAPDEFRIFQDRRVLEKIDGPAVAGPDPVFLVLKRSYFENIEAFLLSFIGQHRAGIAVENGAVRAHDLVLAVADYVLGCAVEEHDIPILSLSTVLIPSLMVSNTLMRKPESFMSWSRVILNNPLVQLLCHVL
jgi:hypothetical protein